MNDTSALYRQLLELSETAFSKELFTVSYHALSAALYCALALQDEEKITQTRRIISAQQEQIKVLFAAEGDTHDGYSQEPVEIVLFRSLQSLSNPRQSALKVDE